MTREATVQELARRVGGTLRGAGSAAIHGVADVAQARADELTFITDPVYARVLPESRAGAVLVPPDFGPAPMPAIACERVDRAVAQVLGFFAEPRSAPPPGVDATATIDPTAELGDGCAIGPHSVIGARSTLGSGVVVHPGAVIGADVRIGARSVIGANAVIGDGCELGRRVTLHPSCAVGGEGFGFYFDAGRHHRVPHIGRVVLEDDVEIGSGSCVDRAKFGVTRVGRGTKIDNHVQVAHNVRLGEHCVLAAQTGISGSSRIGDYCVFGARSGMTDGVHVGERVVVAACTIATRDVPPGTTVFGFPAQEIRREKRERAALRLLPRLLERFRRLMTRVEQLEATTDDQPRGGV